ncbi:hypothetical protein KEM56_003440 [Ascosphaera pollenicola]|nr:hypothetical protein KEM56_003440 [Ascosphaera pollenicola]
MAMPEHEPRTSAFLPPSPGAKIHFTPKREYRVHRIRDGRPLPGPRLWDRAPVTPVAPRRKTHKAWKRFVQTARDTSVKDKTVCTGVKKFDPDATLRGTKRLKISHEDQDIHIGRSFLETRREAEHTRLRERKRPHTATLEEAISSPVQENQEITQPQDPDNLDASLFSIDTPLRRVSPTKESNRESVPEPENVGNKKQSITADDLAPISSPAPVYISPETSWILAEEDDEETTILKSAPMTSTLPSSPPAKQEDACNPDHTLNSMSDTPSKKRERMSDADKSNVLITSLSQSPPDNKSHLEHQLLTPPALHHPFLPEDDVEFLAEFLMQARHKREARMSSLPVRTMNHDTGAVDSSSRNDPSIAADTHRKNGSEETQPSSSPDRDTEERSESTNQATPDESAINGDKLSVSRLRDAYAQMRVDKSRTSSRHKGMGLRKSMRTASTSSTQPKNAGVPAVFDSISITRRVRSNNSRGVENQRPSFKIQVKPNPDDPVAMRHVLLNTQKNTKLNKGDAKRAPTTLRRMRLEAKRKKSAEDSGPEGEDAIEKPKRDPSKRVRWNEEQLVKVIDEELDKVEKSVICKK